LITAKQVISLQKGRFEPEPAFLARHLTTIVPNPWRAYEISKKILDKLLSNNSKEKVINNFVYIIQAAIAHLETVRDELAKVVFENMLQAGEMKFIIVNPKAYAFPKDKEIDASQVLRSKDGLGFVERSLFEHESVEELDDLEKKVAWFLDDQKKLLFWFRNIDRKNDSYYLQGWQKYKVYPDFLFVMDGETGSNLDKLYVTEIKGRQLSGNEDTQYKEQLLNKCTELARDISDRSINFEVVHQDEWQQKLSEIFS